MNATAGFPPLFRMAVKSGSPATVLLHIRRGLGVNVAGEGGRTPLMVAAAAGRLEVCQLLIAEGADPDVTDADGETALAIARRSNHAAVADLLSDCHARSGTGAPEAVAAVAPRSPEPPAVAPPSGERDEPGFSLDDADWDAEAEPGPPPEHDPRRSIEAGLIQDAISARIAANTDVEWLDVDLDLPKWTAARDRPAPVSPLVRRLLVQVAATGLATADQLLAAVGGDPDAAAVLGAIVADLGGELVVPGARSWRSPAPRAGEAGRDARERAAEAEALLQGSDAIDALEAHERRMRTSPRLNREGQASLWRNLRQARRDLAFALSKAPHVLDELAARLDQLSDSRPDDAIPGRPEIQTGDDGPEDTVAGDEALESSVDTLDPQLARTLGAAILNARQAPDAGVGLADQLAELDLPVHLIDQVRRALQLDPGSADACAAVGRALKKIEHVRDTISMAYQPLVHRIAWRYQRRGLDLMDLVQEGTIGLLRAINRFDVSRGFLFSTYATWWVRQAITRALADKSCVIRVPVHRQEGARKVSRAALAFETAHGRRATAGELAELLDMPELQVEHGLAAAGFRFSSIDGPPSAGRSKALWIPAPVTTDAAAIYAELRRVVADMLLDLSPREERVLRLRSGLNVASEETLEEIGDAVGVTRERIRQIEAKAERRLRNPARLRRLRPLLET